MLPLRTMVSSLWKQASRSSHSTRASTCADVLPVAARRKARETRNRGIITRTPKGERVGKREANDEGRTENGKQRRLFSSPFIICFCSLRYLEPAWIGRYVGSRGSRGSRISSDASRSIWSYEG